VVPNTALINALRSLNFEYKRMADRVCIYKQKGSTKRVVVRKHTDHDDDYAKVILMQAGMEPELIEKFVAQYRHDGKRR
jgi:hypothetical protein